ncbi:hypothetical protein Tco_0586292 [Tanacetum coccineum]
MEISIADQIALDDALVAPADRLKIGKCNLRLSSDVTSKEATLQVVYDVLKLTPFYKAFQVTADAPEIYMQEFWASAYVHNRSRMISLESSDDDQDDEKDQDDEAEDKNDVDETTHADEDDDEHDDDEKAQDDDDEEQTESEDDGDDFIHPKLTTQDDGDDGDDDIIHEGMMKMNFFRFYPIHTPLSYFIYQRTTSLIDTPATAHHGASFTAPNPFAINTIPLVLQIQQPPIQTPATTASSSLQNLPNFASLFGFDYRTGKRYYKSFRIRAEKILIDKMDANNSINGSDIQRQLYMALVYVYEADKILLDTYGDDSNKRILEMGLMMIKDPSLDQNRGSKREARKRAYFFQCSRESTTTSAGKLLLYKVLDSQAIASQSALVEETQTTDVFEAPAH